MKDEIPDDVGGNSLKPILLIMATLITFFACGSHARTDDVVRQARHLLAQKCFVCHGPDAVRISPQFDDDLSAIVTRAYRLALNRSPSNNELHAAIQFIERQQKDYARSNAANAKSAALADFAQAVFSINEFIYVD
jgi:hypothetical protein